MDFDDIVGNNLQGFGTAPPRDNFTSTCKLFIIFANHPLMFLYSPNKRLLCNDENTQTITLCALKTFTSNAQSVKMSLDFSFLIGIDLYWRKMKEEKKQAFTFRFVLNWESVYVNYDSSRVSLPFHSVFSSHYFQAFRRQTSLSVSRSFWC